MRKIIFCFSMFAFITCAATAQTVIAAKDAAKHIGETVSITAKVFGGKLFSGSNMTLLDIGGYNPNQELTLMIAGADREKFKGQPEVDLKGKDVTITGKLVDFKGKPEIILTDPKQLKAIMMDNVRQPSLDFKK